MIITDLGTYGHWQTITLHWLHWLVLSLTNLVNPMHTVIVCVYCALIYNTYLFSDALENWLLLSFPPAVSTCWFHKKNLYQRCVSNCQLPKYTITKCKNVQHNFISLNTLTNCIFLFMFYLTHSFDSFPPLHPLHKRMRELSFPLSIILIYSLYINKYHNCYWNFFIAKTAIAIWKTIYKLTVWWRNHYVKQTAVT